MHDDECRLPPLARRCIAAGALLMLLGVMLGAFGAHALQGAARARGNWRAYQTGVHYQLLHALGLLLRRRRRVQLAGERRACAGRRG